jgi:GGDEF domain-containing protein
LPPLTAESANLQAVTVPVALVAWGAIVGLGKVDPRAAGPAWWAAALGSLALGLALLPWAALRSPVPPVLQALLGFGALLAALEGMLRFRRWPGEARRWPFGLALLVLVVALAWPWPAGVTGPGRALDGLHALVLGALAWASVRATTPADRSGLWLSAAFAALLGAAYAWRAWAGGVATVGAPAWWLQAMLMFCVGWPLGLMLACYGRAHAHVQALATQDQLTSLANSRQFEARIAALAQQASQAGTPFGLAVFDLEGVREVNALLGRDAGDAMIAEFGRRLRRALRHGDVPARTGGHEFAALILKPHGLINTGTESIGSAGHLAMVLFRNASGSRFEIINYKGAGPALVDIQGGHIAGMFGTMIATRPQILAGKVRALGVTAAKRSAVGERPRSV